MLSRPKRGLRRIRASKSATCSALIGLAGSRNCISSPGAARSGARSKSGNVGEPSGFRKSPDSATRKCVVMGGARLFRLASSAQPADGFGECRLQHPDIAGIADEIEALAVVFDSRFHVRHEATERLLVLAGRGDDLVDRLGELRMVELTGHAKGSRQIEMTDPEAIDAIDGGNLGGVGHTLGGLDLAEQR